MRGAPRGGRDVEGEPLLDDDALDALIRLLRLAQPLSRGLLPRLLLNLCAHGGTRRALLRRLLSLLRPEPLAPLAPGAPVPRALFGAAPDASPAAAGRSPPPLLARRALEVATYLCRHHTRAAQSLPQLPVPPPAGSAEAKAAAASLAKGKGRAGPPAEGEVPTGEVLALTLVLSLLEAQPRGPAAETLEPALQLLETGLLERETEVRLLLLAALAGDLR